MAVNDIYLVSDRINSVDQREVEKLESQIGSLPLGYRDFMEHCGENGELCDELRVCSPTRILSDLNRSRELFTFEIAAAFGDPEPLSKEDFGELYLFATTVDGDRILYFPRHQYALFNFPRTAHFVKHKTAFHDAWMLGGGKHPFPYFNPTNKSRLSRSFHLETRVGTTQLADFTTNYWSSGEVNSVRMPADLYGDSVYVFVKRIGGMITFTHEPENDSNLVFGATHFDQGFGKEVRVFERAIYGYVKG